MPKVSIIVPVHNGRDTIVKAIDSAQNQTYKNLEIIIIDDCSTDDTWSKLQDLAQLDGRIVLTKTPRNMRSSGARNVGLACHTGEWITLLDADDYWMPNRVEKLLSAAIEHDADIVIDNLLIFDHFANKIVDKTIYTKCVQFEEIEPIDIIKRDSPLCGIHSMGYSKPLYRSKLLTSHDIYYLEKLRTNEDFLILIDLSFHSRKTIVLNDAYYVYRHHVSPISRKISPYTHAEDAVDAISYLSDIIKDRYSDILSEQDRLIIDRRVGLFKATRVAAKQKQYLYSWKLVDAILLFLSCPELLTLRAYSVRRKAENFYKLKIAPKNYG